MPARTTKFYPKDSEQARPHREHRSRKALRGMNTKKKRRERLIMLLKKGKSLKKQEQRIKKAISVIKN